MPEALAAPAVVEPRLARGAAVTSVGAAIPERVVPTSEIAARLGVTDGWIESRTGVRERRFAAPGERLSDLAAAAGRDALERAPGIDASSLDLVVVATCTADEVMPAAAPLVAGLLGAARAGAYDVNAACTGFLAAFDLACAQIESGRAGHALVIGADLMSRLVNPDDRRTAALFGDGAGAVLVSEASPGRVGPALLRADSSGAPFIGAGHEPASLVMDGHETFKAAVTRLSEVTVDALAAAEWALADVDVFVYHQANARILSAVGERLALPPERVVNAIGSLGNTSAASIPLALAAAERDGRLLRPGARVLLAAFGAGFTWGATTLVWGGGGDA
ncbi:MAG: 3-oxoacyl-[acyl-carrier-protein] synthase [Thermoleophilaceae bacterium]|nr:3-oxoacyl-[acyl-carrier-protein] synthase [Thermoleophilaceae bacterium]